jgi:hypothetical protein
MRSIALAITILMVALVVATTSAAPVRSIYGPDNYFLESAPFHLQHSAPYLHTNDLSAALACPLGMISYWKLDEISGTIFADVVGLNDGYCSGNDCPLPTGGILNGGRRFLGSERIDVPASADFDWDSTRDFSIELWVNIPSTEACDGSRVFVGRHAGLPAWWVGCDDHSSMAVFSLRDSDAVAKEISGGPPLNDDQWHHVVAVHDGANGELNLYVDGQLAASEPTAFSGHWFSDRNVNIGYYRVAQGPSSYYLAGTLDEIAVYNRALASDEVEYHFAKVPDGKGYCEPVSLAIQADEPHSVAVSPAGPYRFGQQVTLTAHPGPGYIFFEWSGDLTGSVNPATIILDGDKEITARFTPPVYYTLAVDSTGQGWVSLEPELSQYLHGTTVTLTAVPQLGWRFSHWSGDLTGNQNPAQLMMLADSAVTANFEKEESKLFLPLIIKLGE